MKMECDFNNHKNAQGQGPASRTRSRKKRKLRPLQEVASASASPPLKQGNGKYGCEDQQANRDQRVVEDKDSVKHEKQDLWSTTLSKPWLPEKRRLELILDILQRRDTHEIFAEPVDPEEVEDYYEIIKEPMDFGTMRAKLHEGLYQSFEQFEHDVFLITKNAMHFNSSTTIYFRQARAINELATKVFHVLKTHPESFETEFLESRRRNRRKSQREAENSACRTRPKISRNVKPSSMVIDESSKSMSCSLSASWDIKRRVPITNGSSGFNAYLDARDHEVPCDAGEDGGLRSIEADRRCTYEPQMSFLDENESIISMIFSDKNQLELVIQKDISYRESLMLFAKDLGPVVQMIAGQKLLGWSPAQKSQFSTISSSNHREASPSDTVFTARRCQNFLDQVHKHPSIVENIGNRMDLEGDNKGEGMNTTNKMGTTWLKVQDGSDTTSSYGHIKSTTMVDNAKLDVEAQTLELAFEHSHLNSVELELKNMDTLNLSHSEISMSKLSSCYLGEENNAKAEQGPFLLVRSSCEAGQATTLDRCKTSTSPFIFDLPYLRARLGQSNSLGQNAFLQQ